MIFAAHQPQFFSYLGYFAKIKAVDTFVLLDTVQFKKNEFQNRNRIKTSTGIQWLTVPVIHSSTQLISQVMINDNINWRRKHLQALRTNYSKAESFEEIFNMLEAIYSNEWELLSEFNIATIQTMCKYLDIATPVLVASNMREFREDPDLRLIDMAKSLDADEYLAGSGGKDYMDLSKWKQANIKVTFQKYHEKTYSQLFGSYVPSLSVLDALFNLGRKTVDLLH